MAQELNNSDRITRDTVTDDALRELMKECRRKAEQIRSLERQEHSDSTILIAEDRTTPQ